MSDLLASVVIPVRPGCSSLGQCLDRVLNQDAPRKEVIVVCDPGVSDAGDLPEGSEELRVLRHRQSDGVGQLINDGMRAARGHVKVLLMPHCVPIGNAWLQSMLEPFEDDGVGVVVSQCIAAPEARRGLGARLLESVDPPLRRNDAGRPVPTETVSHQCDAYRASVLADVGYFEADGLRHPGEAVDMSIKMADAGYSMLVSDKAVVSHCAQPAGARLDNALRTALDYGRADAALDKQYDLRWLNGGVHAAALASFCLLPLALLSLPVAVALSLLLLAWGAFLALRIPLLGWDCPVLAVNLAAYVGIMLVVRDDWAPGVFGKQMHPAIIRQWCLLAAIAGSYFLLVARAAGQGALRAVRRPGGVRYALPIFLLGFVWWLLAGVGYTLERFVPRARGK
jgi:GT2 family glycosyltransferase